MSEFRDAKGRFIKGMIAPNKGKPLSESTKKKLSESAHRNWLDAEYRKRHKEACIAKGTFKGEKNPFYGRHHSPDAIEKNRQAHLGKRLGNQHRDKIGKSIRKRWEDPEFKKSMTEKLSMANKRTVESHKEGVLKSDQLILEEVKNLSRQGFRAINIGTSTAKRPDIIAIQGNNIKVFAVEVERGTPDYFKYPENSPYDDIIWVLKK